MRIVLLFMITIMLFFLFLVPFIWPLVSTKVIDGKGVDQTPEIRVLAHIGWYGMCILFTVLWSSIVHNRGCWFFEGHNNFAKRR